MNGLKKAESGLRPITAGYLGSLAGAMLGIVFTIIGVGGVLEVLTGHDQDLALDEFGVPALIFAGSLGFIFRLIFWRRVTEAWQARVRVLMTLILGLEVVSVISAVVWFFNVAPPQALSLGGTAGSTLLIGSLCQIATVIWLVRYRQE